MSFEVIELTSEVITLEEARQHLNLTPLGSPLSHPDDDYIEDFLIPTAREAVENYINRAVALQTIKLTMTGWADMKLPFCTLAEIESIKYDDSNNDEQTLDSTTDYWFTKDSELIMRVLPALSNAPDNVRITYTTGYDTESSPPDVMPKAILQAMKLLIGHYYENREATTVITTSELPLGVQSLLTPHREFGL